MAAPGDNLNLSPIGATFHIIKTARETNGQALVMEWSLAPKSSGTPVHIHPAATESYEVLEGALDLYVDGKWRTLTTGEQASVPPRVPHTFRNSTNNQTRVYNTHAPAMRFGDYFEAIHRIVDSDLVEQNHMTTKAKLYLSLVMMKFQDEIRSVRPPHAVIAIGSLAARLLGYKLP